MLINVVTIIISFSCRMTEYAYNGERKIHVNSANFGRLKSELDIILITMRSDKFDENRISLTKKQKCMITEMQGSKDRWLTICNEDEDGQKDLSKTINLSMTEVKMLENVADTIYEVINHKEDDDIYNTNKYAKKSQTISWDSQKKLKCFVLKADGSEELLNDNVYRSEDEAGRALRYTYYDKEAYPQDYKVTPITLMQPERCAVVQFVVHKELAKKKPSERIVEGIDKGYLAALIARTLKNLEFACPLNAHELLDCFLYFGGFEKAVGPMEQLNDIHDKQQFKLIQNSYDTACSFMAI
jgi:hypothetical protein